MGSSKKKDKSLFVVGIGSSAGGLDALRSLLENLNATSGRFCIVVAQHVSPNFKSKLVDLLSSVCDWEVLKAEDNQDLESDKVYVTPPDFEITVKNEKIKLKKPDKTVYPNPSVDHLFTSLAAEYKNKAIGIILSGTGKDGSQGVIEIKKNGGLTICQDHDEASHTSMPDYALKTGNIDIACEVHEMPGVISKYIETGNFESASPPRDSLTIILDLLEKKYRTDFAKYKPSTIDRRIEKRINDLKIRGIDDYLIYIRDKPEELENLYQTMLIGVTAFYRNPEAFDALREKMEDRVITSSDQSLRFWSVGCATGEEPYTIAILLAEILGEQIKNYNIQIFATDIDEFALSSARKGIYSQEALESIPANWIDKYFIKRGDSYEVNKVIRQMVLFSKHDITHDPPFVKIDFIICRNLLIYFKLELQREIIPIFHYALNSSGYLFLGKSENVAQLDDLFYMPEYNDKLFQRKDDTTINRLNFKSYIKRHAQRNSTADTASVTEMSLEEIAQETLVKTFEHPYVVLNAQMETTYVKGSLQPYLDLSEGSLNASILKILHKSLHTELRALFAKVKRSNKSTKSNIIRYEAYDSELYVQLVMKPLLYKKNDKRYFLLIFERIEKDERYPFYEDSLSDDSFKDSIRVVELEQELKASREHLEAFTEELETSNEELQAMNEELQSSNEELKSTNEELETSNEELQSTNEELQTANSELNQSNENLLKKEEELLESQREIMSLNRRFQIVLSNSRIFIAYQDTDLKYIWVYNQLKEYKEEELYGFSDEDIFKGKVNAESFINLKKKVLKNKKEAEQEVFFNDQYWRIKVNPWIEDDELRGVITLAFNITKEKQDNQTLELRKQSIESLIEGSGSYVLIVDTNYSIQVISQKLQKDLQKGQNVSVSIDDSIKSKLEGYEGVQKKLISPIQEALNGKNKKIELFESFAFTDHEQYFTLNAFPIKGSAGEILGAAIVGTEITGILKSKDKIQTALKRGAHLTEEEYFRDLTLQIYELFGCKYTYLGILNADRKSVETTAIRINGKLSSNFTYELNGAPCGVVNFNDEIQIFDQVEQLFPDDPKLNRWDAETYVGIPISSPITGELLGIMVMISDHKLDLTTDDEYILTILSLRAGAELLRSQTTKELQLRDNQLQKITDNSPDIICEFQRDSDGTERVGYISRAVEEIYELTPDELFNNPSLLYSRIHPEDWPSFKKIQDQNKTNPVAFEWTGRIITAKTEQVKWIKMSSNPEILQNGDVIWNGVIDDISDIKKTEKELEQAKETAEEAAMAKENFLATMSHEIRTPLNAIYGIVELLQIDEKTKDLAYLDILKYSAENLLSLINNILDFSKIKAGKLAVSKRQFNIHELLDNVSKTMKFQADLKNNALILKKGDKLPDNLYGDELILAQVLNNLLSNANKFTEGGNITLLAEQTKETKKTATILFAIQDTGSGIDTEKLEEIFEKFEQTTHDKASRGSGLGLTITKALLELYNSQIKVQSSKGTGSRFYFDITFDKVGIAENEGRESGEAETNNQDAEKTKHVNILMVEDTEDNRKLVLAYLSKHDYISVDTAENGLQALEKIKTKKYDMVLMDMRMPEMRGDQATEVVRSWESDYFKKIPIIALTADTYGIKEETGFTDVITKPFKFKDLLHIIDKYGLQYDFK
ncbi:response regulator [Fulvivirga sp. RKSG066]|uniref:CheR family methyltransferase n=1 Tax=Fulvivirga aurantia TaxID=2529383 RepID=UPI0012BC8127|nr:CheR family methyltransferase [Fulvivirga aurantia]MTI21288.1 response regulator [Fulvivirga aurantia]